MSEKKIPAKVLGSKKTPAEAKKIEKLLQQRSKEFQDDWFHPAKKYLGMRSRTTEKDDQVAARKQLVERAQSAGMKALKPRPTLKVKTKLPPPVQMPTPRQQPAGWRVPWWALTPSGNKF